MKKYLLSIFTLGLFGIFVGYQKVQSIEEGQTGNANSTSLTMDDLRSNSPSDLNQTDITPNHTVAINNTQAPSKATNKTVPTKSVPSQILSKYKDGTYIGTRANAYYGYIQVEAVINNGQITDVIFLDHPSDQSESQFINSRAMPILRSEAISAQSANVAIVSRATDSSMAFRQSMAAALSQALN